MNTKQIIGLLDIMEEHKRPNLAGMEFQKNHSESPNSSSEPIANFLEAKRNHKVGEIMGRMH